jgi:peptide-methionine (S)-S-oxide reductase
MPLRRLAFFAVLAGIALLALAGPDPSSLAVGGEAGQQDRTCAKADRAEGRQSPARDAGPPAAPGGIAAATPGPPRTAVATFGMGCFWGAEADFCGLRGVIDTAVGYAGGRTPSPDYRAVSTGRTGHAEVVQVRYDPAVISYEELLEVFWRRHDPTTPNRQGPDMGTQYRSLILFHDAAQEAAARASRERQGRRLSRPIVTEIKAAGTFHPAEDYHQRYLERRGRASCNR